MKLKITYGKSKDKFYFNFSNNRHRSFYGLDAAIEFFHRNVKLSYSTCEQLLLKLSYNDEIIEIEV